MATTWTLTFISFLTVPEGKVAKNRVHLDVQDGTPDHVLMADPEGNEFCVV